MVCKDIDFKKKLSQRIRINDIYSIISLTKQHDKQKQALFELIFDTDDQVAYQALWVLTHFSPDENQWLCSKQNALIDEVLICHHSGKRRLLLTLLYRQPIIQPLRIDFLDFCLNRMASSAELPGVQTLCMKQAYELCRSIPELLSEFQTLLEMMETDRFATSLRTAHKNVLKAMKTRKTMQKNCNPG